MRIGHGYDVHRLVDGKPLILGGVHIPYKKGLLGHSDADAVLHATMDALLGAAALGDIGKHFPDTDEKYKGISSLSLLEEVVKMLEEKGHTTSNVDITILAEQPKMAPYINQMRENIAKVLKININNVNVKATTTEGLGFVGREEGIAVHVVSLII